LFFLGALAGDFIPASARTWLWVELNRPGMSGNSIVGDDGVLSRISSRRYPPELRERAVRMVAEISDQHESQWVAMGEVARLLGVGTAERVRKWVRQSQVDAGALTRGESDRRLQIHGPPFGP
jgi:transposase-like protein